MNEVNITKYTFFYIRIYLFSLASAGDLYFTSNFKFIFNRIHLVTLLAYNVGIDCFLCFKRESAQYLSRSALLQPNCAAAQKRSCNSVGGL